jgi:putative transposase
MVGAPQRRLGVGFLVERKISQRRACELLDFSRSSCRYRLHPRTAGPVGERLKALAHRYPRYGYRRLTALLRREGQKINPKRVHRLWKQLGLSLRFRPKRKRRRGLGSVPQQAVFPNHVWTYDFLEDACISGQKLRLLTVVDEFTRECLAIEVAGSFNAPQVIGVLEILLTQHGAPQFLRSDNGPEFIAQALQQWLTDKGIATFYIEPGSPWQNAYGESFNGKFRDECLNMELFVNRNHAHQIIENFRQHYNTQRPHSSLGYQTPAEFKAAWTSSVLGALPPNPQSFSPSRPPEGQKDERQSLKLCPSVRPPESALGSLSSVALFSAPVT